MAIILETKKICKTYGFNDNRVEALKPLDLQIEEGSFVAIVGKSGSGKSTLLHILGGLSRPNSGEVILEGQSIFDLNDDKLSRIRRRRMGFIFQFFNLLPTQNVLENIVLPIHLDNMKEDKEHVDKVISFLGLEDKKTAFIHELSGGQQQRVAIARALASKPAIIFADEPTGNLDVQSSKEVLDLLQLSKRQFHQTIVLVTHDSMMASKADRIITIEDGKIIKDTGYAT